MSDKGKSTRMVLEEVSEDKFPELVEAIKAYLPASFNVQSMVTTHLKYSHLDKIGARVYTPNHAAYRYKMVVITPVATAPRFQSLSLFWSEKDVSEEEVTVLLRSLPEFKWDLPVLVRPVAADLEDEMNRIVFKLSEGVLVKAYPLDLLVYVHDGPLPPVPKLPEGYYMKEIDPRFIQQILASWAGNFLESVEGFNKCFKALPNLGVFKRRNPGHTEAEQGHSAGKCSLGTSVPGKDDTTSSSEDELASFVMLKQSSDVGVTYTEFDHRRIGLASIATASLMETLRRDEQIIFVTILNDNMPSVDMHIKLGYRFYSNELFIIYYPESLSLVEFPSHEPKYLG